MTGRVWRFGDDVNTDVITPGRYNVTTDADRLAEIAFCEVRPAFATDVRDGDVLVAGDNFGCGSSRESAPRAIQACGVAAVVARGFGRIFYRNAVNIGLPVYVSPTAADVFDDGDEARVDRDAGALRGPAGEAELEAAQGVAADIAAEGGIVNYLQRRGGLGD